MSEFAVPTNPDDLKRIKNAIVEASAVKQMIADRNEQLKDIRTAMKDDYKMDGKTFNKLVAAHFKQNYEDVTVEHSQFELLYESLFDMDSDDDDSEAAA